MITEEHIQKLSKPLTDILNAELNLGNKIVETFKGWPYDETVMVFLDAPFKRSYNNADLEFRELNDPHYWKSEYFDKSSRHVLACKFG